MVIVLFAARLVLAMVFAASGVAKILDPAGTRKAIAGFGLPDHIARVGAWPLAVAEIGVGASMLAASTAWWSSVGALILLAAFCAAIAWNLRHGRSPDCHCFGQLHSEPVSATTLGRNAALAVPAVVVLVAGRSDAGPSAVAWLGNVPLATAILSGVCATLTTALIATAYVVRRLLFRQRELAESLAVLERVVDAREEGRPAVRAAASQTPRGLPVGAPAPDGRLATSTGDAVTLAGLSEGHAMTALLFVSNSCSPCRELLHKLDTWQRDSGRLRLIAVAPGSRQANARLLADHPNLPLHVAGDAPVAASYRALWTPAAVVVANGRIASETKFGVADIESLLDTAGSGARLAPSDSKIGAPAPEFAAIDDQGTAITNRIFTGGPTAVLSWSSACGYCAALAEELEEWADEGPSRVPRLILITQKTEPVRHRFGAEAVIVDSSGEISRAFGFSGTPSAILVEADGTIASSVCVGGEDVKSLLGIVGPATRASAEAARLTSGPDASQSPAMTHRHG